MPNYDFNKCFCNLIEITLRHGCSVNLLHIFRNPFPKNTSERLLLYVFCLDFFDHVEKRLENKDMVNSKIYEVTIKQLQINMCISKQLQYKYCPIS